MDVTYCGMVRRVFFCRSPAGYTLLELLVTMSVCSCLALASLGLGELLQRTRQALAIAELQQLVQFARGQAVNLQQEVVLCALDANRACQRSWTGQQVAVFMDADRDRKLGDGEALRLVDWPAERGRLAWRASLGRPFLAFSAMGSTNQNGSFILCREEDSRRPDVVLTLNRGGRPYLNTPGRRRCPD